MEALWIEVIFIIGFFWYVMSYNCADDIMLKLDRIYYDPTELKNAVVQYLKDQNKKCKAINDTTLIVNSNKYKLTETKIFVHGVQTHQIILKKEKMNIHVISNES